MNDFDLLTTPTVLISKKKVISSIEIAVFNWKYEIHKHYQENTISCETKENFFGLFLLSIRKANGSEYEPDTLSISRRKENKY